MFKVFFGFKIFSGVRRKNSILDKKDFFYALHRRISALQFDIRYIEQNTVAFNEPGTAIVKSARILTEALLEFIQ